MSIDEGVLHDGEEPCLEVGIVAEFVAEHQGSGNAVLQQVQRVITIAREAQCEVVQLLSKTDQLLLELECRHGELRVGDLVRDKANAKCLSKMKKR